MGWCSLICLASFIGLGPLDSAGKAVPSDCHVSSQVVGPAEGRAVAMCSDNAEDGILSGGVSDKWGENRSDRSISPDAVLDREFVGSGTGYTQFIGIGKVQTVESSIPGVDLIAAATYSEHQRHWRSW